MSWSTTASRQAIIFGSLVLGCLVDPARLCGDDYREADNGSCLCPEGSRLSDGRCEPEPEGDAPRDDTDAAPAPPCERDGGACDCQSSAQCATGLLCDAYDTGRCVSQPSGLDQSCSSSEECAGNDASYCESLSSGTCQIDGCAEQGGACPGDMACCRYAIISRSFCIRRSALEAGACPAPGQLVAREP